MLFHLFDPVTREYLHTATPIPNPEEPGKWLGGGPWSTEVAPPEIPDGKAAVWNDSSWDLVEDHRGMEGYVHGSHAKIGALGPLPGEWSEVPPQPEDTRTPEEKRRDAYRAEADPLFQQALYYQAEADGFRLLDELSKATIAEEKAREFLREYVLKKEEIRSRHPDDPKEINEQE